MGAPEENSGPNKEDKQMREYEMMVIIDPDIGEDAIAATIDKLKQIIVDNNGEIENIDEWGKRTLAYEIRHKKEGYYVVYQFKADPTVPDKLRRELRLNRNLMRGMIIRRGD